MGEVDDVELVVERVAALDLGTAGLEACVRVPHEQRPGRRMQELRSYATTTTQLLSMVDWFRYWRVQRAVMDSTSTYWKGVYYLLDAGGFECWLVNAREVKNVPGRAKTDRADAVWLAKVAERGMCRPSLVHPPEIRRLRDLTRYRRADCALRLPYVAFRRAIRCLNLTGYGLARRAVETSCQSCDICVRPIGLSALRVGQPRH